MVLGKEGVGKTHLYQGLKGNNGYSQDISTNGIDIGSLGLNDMELTCLISEDQKSSIQLTSFLDAPMRVSRLVQLNDTDC